MLKKTLKTRKRIIIAIFIFLFAFVITPCVSAQGIKDSPDKTLSIAWYGGYADNLSITEIIGRIITGALSMVGVVFLILIIYGGYLWMTGRENEQQMEKAKKTIQASIIGLMIVVGAYAITYFVVNLMTGGNENMRVLDSGAGEDEEGG